MYCKNWRYFLRIAPKFAISHNELQVVSENACYQCFIKRVNITHSQSHGVDFGINVLHSGEFVAPCGVKGL